jgi:hypothetical protein
VTRLVQQDAPDLSAADCNRAAALVRVLASAHAWELMRDNFGLRGTDAGEVAAWAIRTLRSEWLRTRRILDP